MKRIIITSEVKEQVKWAVTCAKKKGDDFLKSFDKQPDISRMSKSRAKNVLRLWRLRKVAAGLAIAAGAIAVVGYEAALSAAGAVTYAFAYFCEIPPDVMKVIHGWHGTLDERLNCLKNLYKRLNADKVPWAVAPEMLTKLKTYIDTLQDLFDQCASPAASAEARSYRDNMLKEAVDWCEDKVWQFVNTLYEAGTIHIADVHLLGFLAHGESHGRGGKLGIILIMPTIKVSISAVDIVRVVIERNAQIDSEQGSGGAWAKGAKGLIIAFKIATEPASTFRYEYSSKIHSELTLPSEWRGKDVVFKAAYVAHPNDKKEDLHWSAEQTLTLPRTNDEIYNTGGSND